MGDDIHLINVETTIEILADLKIKIKKKKKKKKKKKNIHLKIVYMYTLHTVHKLLRLVI